MMTTLLVSSKLRYFQRSLFSGKWKDGYFRLYANGIIEWYDNEIDLKPKGVVNLKDVAEFICTGSYTKHVPHRPFPSDSDDKLLMCFPKNLQLKANEVCWVYFSNDEQLADWIQNIKKILPQQVQSPHSHIHHIAHHHQQQHKNMKNRMLDLKRAVLGKPTKSYPHSGNLTKPAVPSALIPIQITPDQPHRCPDGDHNHCLNLTTTATSASQPPVAIAITQSKKDPDTDDLNNNDNNDRTPKTNSQHEHDLNSSNTNSNDHQVTVTHNEQPHHGLSPHNNSVSQASITQTDNAWYITDPAVFNTSFSHSTHNHDYHDFHDYHDYSGATNTGWSSSVDYGGSSSYDYTGGNWSTSDYGGSDYYSSSSTYD